jgi:integrase
MAVRKRVYRSGKTAWYYVFDAIGSTRENRHQITESGFSTKREAQVAEARRRVDEAQRRELVKAGRLDAPVPRTLATLLQEFFAEYAEKKLAGKTVERYRQQAGYLSPELLAMPLTEITALHLAREWNRLLESGGRCRGTQDSRPLSSKTVRNIAGVLSSAFARAVKWSLVAINPVPLSEPPVPRRKNGLALTPEQLRLAIDAATGCWCLPVFLELSSATGARRGELLALRWSDVHAGEVFIARSLSQTKAGLTFKSTKTGTARAVVLPESAVAALASHHSAQLAFRNQFGTGYRADLDLIFANPDGSLLRPDSISSSVSALFRKLKLPKGASLHTIRHSHGSHLLAAGMELPAVSERLGHSSVFVTATVYSHRIKGRDEEAARRWEEFQRRNTPEKSSADRPV